MQGSLLFVERAPVAFDAGLELGELAVSGALGSAGHLFAGGELCEGLAHPECFGWVAAVFVDGGEALVGVTADELLGDAGVVELDGPLCVAVLEGPLGLLVALHRGLEVKEWVLFRPDPPPFLLVEPVEGRGLFCGRIRPPEHAPQSPENQTLPSGYTRPSISERFSDRLTG